MNRTLVLDCIQKHLTQLDANSHTLRPLGEIVPIIAEEIRNHRNGAVPKVQVLPVAVVAAFVDGFATQEEERAVCAAILFDNSVLAEIIATVRAQREMCSAADGDPAALPPLSDSLTDRLLGLIPTNKLVKDHLPPTSEMHATSPSAVSQVLRESETNLEAAQSSVPRWLWWSSIAALAAAVAVAVWLGLPKTGEPTKHEVARDVTNEPFHNQTIAIDDRPGGAPRVDADSPEAPPMTPVEPKSDVELANKPLVPNEVVNKTDKSMEDSNSDTTAEIGPKSVPSLQMQPKNYARGDSKGQVQPTALRWTKIHGLLARQHLRDASETSLRDKWSGTAEGLAVNLPGNSTEVLRLRTFPGSHAQANLQSGGKLVVNSESAIEIKSNNGSVPNYLVLEQGAVALVDFPKGTQIEVSFGGNRIANLEWESKASVVLGGTAAGLQSQIVGGSVRVNDKVYKSLTLSMDQTRTQEMKSLSKQLPVWVNRPTETTMLPKAVLGQLALSEDLEESINQLMKETMNGRAMDELTRSQLTGWRSALEEDDLYRALSHRGPVLRALAFKRAMQQPAWSAKWQDFWPQLERSVGDAAKVSKLQNAVALAQSNTRIGLDQAIQLVSAMDTNDRASRVLTDLLLRQLVGNGPTYNPDANEVENGRNMGLWRRFINANLNR